MLAEVGLYCFNVNLHVPEPDPELWLIGMLLVLKSLGTLHHLVDIIFGHISW